MKLESLFQRKNLLESFEEYSDNSSPIEALTKIALENNLTIEEASNKLVEVAPKNSKAEDFIKSAKDSFKKRYGKNWERVLYATAWKKFKESKNMKNRDMVAGENNIKNINNENIDLKNKLNVWLKNFKEIKRIEEEMSKLESSRVKLHDTNEGVYEEILKMGEKLGLYSFREIFTFVTGLKK